MSQRTILITDDEPHMRRLLDFTVRKTGHRVLQATSGEDALEWALSSDFALILLDIMMPEMNGYEATKQIREFNKEVIIIAQTAFAFSGDREKSIAAGCNDYISKPIKKLELEILIQKHINKS